MLVIKIKYVFSFRKNQKGYQQIDLFFFDDRYFNKKKHN